MASIGIADFSVAPTAFSALRPGFFVGLVRNVRR